MTSFLAFTLLFVQKHSCLYNKKKITQWLEDMNSIFSWLKTVFYSLIELVRKTLFLPLENKIHIFAPPCNILYKCRFQIPPLWSSLVSRECKINYESQSCLQINRF